MARRKNANREQVSQDISSLIAEKSVLEQEVETTREELADNRKVIEEELLKGKSELDTIKLNIQTLESRREGIRKEIEELAKESAGETVQIGLKEEAIAGLILDIDENTLKLIKVEGKIEQAEAKLAKLEDTKIKISDANKQLDELTQELVSKKNVLFGELKLMNQDLSKGQKELEDIKFEIQVFNEALVSDKASSIQMTANAKAAAKLADEKMAAVDEREAEAVKLESQATSKMLEATTRSEALDTRERIIQAKEEAQAGKDEELKIAEGKVRQAIRFNKLKEKGIL